MKLNYFRCGDYLFPDMGLSEQDQQPLGKYGRLRMDYLRKEHPGRFNYLLLSGKLMEHLHEIDNAANDRLDLMMNSPLRPSESLKASDQMEWVAQMNALKAQAEELIMNELIYN